MKEWIYNEIKQILITKFNQSAKHSIKDTSDVLRFACPYCGDSHENDTAKRGNLYFDTALYHCYNCGKHTTLLKLLANFNRSISPDQKSDVTTILNSNATKPLNRNIDIADIKKYAIPLSTLKDKLGCTTPTCNHLVIRSRLLQHKVKHIGVTKKHTYYFNLIDDDLVIGYQVKMYNKFYKKFTLVEIHKTIMESDVDIDELQKLNKYSLIYNFFNIDYSQPVTIFEGVIDSWFYPNSIALSTVNTDTSFLEYVDNKQYFFDNDNAGMTKMFDYIKNKDLVFLWGKFLQENNIPTIIKDLNELMIYLYKNKRMDVYQVIPNYFSNNTFDMIYM